MRKLAFVLAFVLALIPVVAFAQQPQPTTIDQLLVMHSNIEASLAKQLDAAHAQIADLQKQLAEAKAKEAKPDAKQKP